MKNSVLESLNFNMFFVIQTFVSQIQAESLDRAVSMKLDQMA